MFLYSAGTFRVLIHLLKHFERSIITPEKIDLLRMLAYRFAAQKCVRYSSDHLYINEAESLPEDGTEKAEMLQKLRKKVCISCKLGFYCHQYTSIVSVFKDSSAA